MGKAVLTRFCELTKVAFDVMWRPSVEHPRKLIGEYVVPVVILALFTAMQFTVLKVIENHQSEYGTNVEKGSSYVLYTPPLGKTEGLSSYCYKADGSLSYNHCVGVIDECGNPYVTSALKRLTDGLLQEDDRDSQIVSFDSYEDAERRVLKWVGYSSVPESESCGDCEVASKYGYFLAARKVIVAPEKEDGEPVETCNTMVMTRDFDSLFSFKSDSPTYNLAYIDLYGVDAKGKEAAGGAAALLYGEFMRELAASTQEEPVDDELELPAIREVRSAVVKHTDPDDATGDTSMMNSVSRLASIILVPAFALVFSTITSVTISSGINRILLQSGQHAFPQLLAVLSKLAMHLVWIMLFILVAWLAFPDVYDPLFKNTSYTFGTGFFSLFITLAGYMIQCVAIAALVPNRVVAIVVSILLIIFGPGITTVLTLQNYTWPYYLVCAIIPCSFLSVVPDTLGSYYTLLQTTKLLDMSQEEVPKVTLKDLFVEDFPNNINSALLDALPDSSLASLKAAPWVYVTVSISICVWFFLIYIGLAIRPIEEKGSYRWKAVFTRLPECTVLRGHALRRSRKRRGSVDGMDEELCEKDAAHEEEAISSLMESSVTEENGMRVERLVTCSATNIRKHYRLPLRTQQDTLDSLRTQHRLVDKGRRHYLAAVRDVSCQFERGRITALIGMNGAGKTTLLRVILGIERPTSGSVRVLNADPYASPRALLDVLPLVGFVQQHNIVADFSCRLHCEIMAAMRCVPGGRPAWRKEAERCLDAVGLIQDGKMEALGNQLSGGQKRRLMIAMAMCGAPPLLVLDEPSAGLSADAKVELDLAIRAAAKHSSVIITEHDLDEVDGLADKLVIVRDGIVVAEGTSFQLKEKYGSGYTLRVTFGSDCPLTDIMDHANRLFSICLDVDPLARFDCQSGRDVFFVLSRSANVAVIGRRISAASDIPVSSFAFDIATLSDVFMALAIADIDTVEQGARDSVSFRRETPAIEMVEVDDGEHSLSSLVQSPSVSDKHIEVALESPRIVIEDSSAVEQASTDTDEFHSIPAPSDVEPLRKEIAVDEEASELIRRLQQRAQRRVPYHRMLGELIRKSWTVGWRSVSVMSMQYAQIALCTALTITLLSLLPMIEDMRHKLERPISFSNSPGQQLVGVAYSALSRRIFYRICEDGTEIPGDVPCKWDDPAQMDLIGTLIGRITSDNQQITDDDEWVGLIEEEHADYLPPTSSQMIQYQRMPQLLLDWRGPDRVVVYMQPDFYTSSFMNIALPTGPANAVAAILELARRGFNVNVDGTTVLDIINGRTPSVPSALFDPTLNNCTDCSALRTFANDQRGTAFLPIMMIAPMMGIFFCAIGSSLTLVIPYLLTNERVTGFGLQLRLLGERKGANMFSYFISICLVNVGVTFVFTVVFSSLNLLLPTFTDNPVGDSILFSVLFGIGNMFSGVSWTILGTLISYMFKQPTTVFQAMPIMQFIELITYFIIVAWAALNYQSMTLEELSSSWDIIELVLGIIPFTQGISFGARAVMTGNFNSIFPLEYRNVAISAVVQPIFTALLFIPLYYREEVEWGSIKMRAWAKRIFTLGGNTHGDSPQPSRYNYQAAGFDVEKQHSLEMIKHPREDETVALERERVKELPADTVLAFRDARREFVGQGRPPTIVQAVRGLDILVRRGDCLGLVGENGAGKSTALSMAIKQLTPTSGDVVVEAQRIGYVPQQNAYQPMLTVRQHVETFAVLSGMELTDAISIAYTCGLKPHMSKRPDQLSGGYKRRLCLALALITSTELLIADEVAAGVDIHAQREIQALMDSLKTAGCSLVVTSHHMETVDRLVSRVAMMVKGRLRAIDTPDALKQKFTQGLAVTMQIIDGHSEAALRWLAQVSSCAVQDIKVLPSLGGDCRFILPTSCPLSDLDLLDILRPGKTPDFILRAAVAPTSLQSVFLCFEEESRDLKLTNW